jgi:hypothetical protein
LRGKILIDSPGFDADAQRNSTLRIADHIIDLSDLVLVFFDARHPESGSMRDTLEHLVSRTMNRRDSNKFLYILNQIDNTALEDNTEEVFASWQRALAQSGMTAGAYYAMYIPDAAVPIADADVRARFESKRNAHLVKVFDRIERVGEERAYRIVGMLEETAKMIEQDMVPRLQRFLASWHRRIFWLDGVIFGGLLAAFAAATIRGGYWDGLTLNLSFLEKLPGGNYTTLGLLAILLVLIGYIHFSIRHWSAKSAIRKSLVEIKDSNAHGNYRRAFQKNTRWYQSVFRPQPAGWSRRTHRRLGKILEDTYAYVQKLNDLYTNPSGDKGFSEVIEPLTCNTMPSSEPSSPDSKESREVFPRKDIEVQ